METSPVKQLLRCLCTNSPWSYAIFWKLQQQSPMLFIFGDGYFDNLKLQQSCSNILDDLYPGQEDVISFLFGKSFLGRESNAYPIGFVLDEMSCRQYKEGEGLVGEVALSGDDLWIQSDDIGSVEFTSELESADEWLLLMKAGIKTTLLAPILAHGVLQLGSLEKVAKNLDMVADIKSRFIAFQTTIFTTSHMSDTNGLLLSSTAALGVDKDNSSLSNNSLHNVDYEYPEEVRINKIANQSMLPPKIGNCLQSDEVTAIPRFTVDQDDYYLYSDLDIQPNTVSQFVIADIMYTTEDVWTFACQDEGYYDAGVPEASSSRMHNYLTPEEIQLVPEVENGGETGFINVGDFTGFPQEYELQDVLGAVFQAETDRHSSSSDEENVYLVGDFCPLATEPAGWFGEGDDQGHLLEAAVTSLCNNSDETISYWCNSSRSCVTSFAEIAPSFQVQTLNEGVAAMLTDDTIDVFGESTILCGNPNSLPGGLTSPSSFESLASGVAEEEQPMKYHCGLTNGSAEVPRVRGKSKPKTSQRPKPRDRQLIQDRLKELRDLVPNGEKCSIDGLLDQAIKHMMFLKSVTQQAEKVKQFSDQEFIGNGNRETSRSNPAGTSWAMEVADNPGSCPIIVKDLEHPGDILIKMLCNNEDVFFEMAQVMHQLKLTILKGVMETHSEKWAHFVVQASNGFNRLDIFWPLMRILQRNGNWSLNQWCPNI